MPFRRKRQEPEIDPRSLVLSDAATAMILGGSGFNWSDEPVNEDTAMSLSGVYRGVLTIANAIAGLPLKTYRTYTDDDGAEQRERIASIFDEPAGSPALIPEAQTPFEWAQTNFLHLILQGEAPMLHRYNEAGALVGLEAIHPLALSIARAPRDQSGPGKAYPDGKVYSVSVYAGPNGETKQEKLGSDKITVVYGPMTNGLRGMSFLSFGRNSLGISLAGEKAAAKAFKNGAMLPGVLRPAAAENLSIKDIEAIKADLDVHLFGTDNAGSVPIVNKVVEFVPWAMTLADAQFIESRQFQLEEQCRWVGVPPHLVYDLSKSTSWGTGIAEQNKNLSQYVLRGHSMPFEQRCSRLLANPRFVEFDYAGLEAGSARDVSTLLLAEVNGGIRLPNEARRILNLPPVEGGDSLRVPSGVKTQDQLDAEAAAAAGAGATSTEGQPNGGT